MLWGIHNDQPTLHLIEGGFVSVGWEELGDLRDVTPDRETLKARLAAAYPAAKPGAIPVWAGVLHRFIVEMQIGDFVLAPSKADRTLNFGRVTGDFYVEEASADLHPNRRPVQWVRTGVPRAEFSASALHEIGSALTLFRVKAHADEFLAAIEGGKERPTLTPASSDDAAVDLAEEEPNANPRNARRRRRAGASGAVRVDDPCRCVPARRAAILTFAALQIGRCLGAEK